MAKSLSPEARDLLVTWSVRLSFWLGGCLQVLIKGFALCLSGSSLVRASMFESLGDMMSSAILAVTQLRVRDPSDNHLYPTGKRRLTPLGILFFSAFAASTMTGLAIQSTQTLFEAPQTEESSGAMLRRLFQDKPKLRRGLRPAQIEELVAEYAGDEKVDAQRSNRQLLTLLCFCIAIKGGLLVFCSYVGRRADSEIARTLAKDHRNDVVTNLSVVAIVIVCDFLKHQGHSGTWLEKVDPVASLLLASYIMYSWMQTAVEQINILSNRRADDENVEAVIALASRHLETSSFILSQAEMYHIGDGYAVRFEIQPKPVGQQAGSEHYPVAVALEALESAVLRSDLDVHEVHARLRQPYTISPEDHSWAAQYSAAAK